MIAVSQHENIDRTGRRERRIEVAGSPVLFTCCSSATPTAALAGTPGTATY